MKRIGLLTLGVLGVMANVHPALAAVREGQVMLMPFVNYTWYASRRDIKNAGGFGGAIGYATNQHLMMSFSVAGSDSQQTIQPKKDSLVMQYAVDGNWYFGPYGTGFQPYLGAGVGVFHIHNVLHAAPATQANLHANAGLAYFFTPKIALQGGGQYFYTVTKGGYSDFAANAGVVFLFGQGSGNADKMVK